MTVKTECANSRRAQSGSAGLFDLLVIGLIIGAILGLVQCKKSHDKSHPDPIPQFESGEIATLALTGERVQITYSSPYMCEYGLGCRYTIRLPNGFEVDSVKEFELKKVTQ